jgi:hypothetical protein
VSRSKYPSQKAHAPAEERIASNRSTTSATARVYKATAPVRSAIETVFLAGTIAPCQDVLRGADRPELSALDDASGSGDWTGWPSDVADTRLPPFLARSMGQQTDVRAMCVAGFAATSLASWRRAGSGQWRRKTSRALRSVRTR